METSNFRPQQQLHVAQQSRREKLRVQNHDQFSGDHEDIAQPRSFRYGNNLSYDDHHHQQVLYPSSEMINNFDSASNSSQPLLMMAAAHTSSKDVAMSGDPHNCSTWKSIGSQESTCDWNTDSSNPNPIFVGSQGLSASFKSIYNMRPGSSSYGYHHHHEVQSSYLTSQPPGEMNYNSSSLYHGTNIVPQEMGFGSMHEQNNREAYGNELHLLPAWSNRDLIYTENKSMDHRDVPSRISGNDHGSSNYTQALSLSLSSIPLCKSHVGCDRMVPEDLHSGGAAGNCYSNLNQDVKALKSEYLGFDEKASYNGKGIENVVGNNPTLVTNRSGVGPLGPFTGYATILKSSRFLKPAQQLLEEFCNMVGPKSMKNLEYPEKLSNEVRASCTDFDVAESIAGGALARDSGGSSSTYYSSNNNEKIQEVGGLSSSNESYRPEYLQKKAKLLYMLEEVCRKYKQYNQQMQMVVSAFESVAGLSAATPYISLALKSISRHFRCLKSAISDQLKNVRKALGEDFSSPTTGTTSSSDKGDTSMTSRLKLMDRTIQKQKGTSYFECQQHVWRPQRGLPERAVAILRAWLFDHFLHPYPTDADKHMLASQTGLSRNQVSNWFINARVRVWKPMVEEIHMLETKGSAETSSVAGKPDETTGGRSLSSNDTQPLNRLNSGGFSEKPVESMDIGSSGFVTSRMNVEAWNQKRSRVECHNVSGQMDGSVVSFSPYQQSGIDIGSLGAVSLTLGLRRNVDGLQPQQQQHDNHHLRRHFGDQIIYDFVG